MRNYTDFDSAQVPNAPSTILIVCQDPVSSSLPSCFELAPTICIQMYNLQLTFQQLSKTVKTLRRDAAQSFQHCCMTRVPSCRSLFCHGFAASPGHIIKSPHNTISPGCGLEITMMCAWLHWGAIQINNCELLCTAWVEDTTDLQTIKLTRDHYVFLH